MKIVILGAGIRGFQIAKHLISEHNDVVLIEPNPEQASFASSKLDCIVINGSGNSVDTLKEAGVADADFFIAMTDSDEVNMVACGIVSSEFDVPSKIACIRNLTYLDLKGLSGNVLGIDYIVNPEAEAARTIYGIVEKGDFNEVITFEKSDLLFHNILISEDSRFVYKHVRTIRRYMHRYNFLITSVNRKSRVFIPSGDTEILPDDIISVVSEEKGMDKIFRSLGHVKKKMKKGVIIGGSKTAWFLLKNFSPVTRSRFTLVDMDSEVCKRFASQYPELLVIKSDVTDEVLYEDEDIGSYDIILNLTDNDELNIITAIYAKRIGVDRALALIKNNNNYLRLTPHLDIDSVVAVSRSTVSSVLRYIRGENYSTVQTIFDGKVEICEFTIQEDSSLIGKKIRDISLKGRALIAALTRDGRNIIPSGETGINAGDVVVVTAERASVAFIQKIFS
ncbi:MAG: Trk system potassium transporter TrkA [Spirochaetales bacterium]|nr:Trk system potassium transporter TrkA [Spirochaetales bacterium]